MTLHAPLDPSQMPRRRKAALIVQMLIGDGGTLDLSELPEPLQIMLTEELGNLRLVDRYTVEAVAEEFAAELDAIGLTAPGDADAAVLALADHLSPPLAARLRSQVAAVRNGDHWPRVVALSDKDLLRLMSDESIPVCAVALSKLPVAKAAALLAKLPGERARRITLAMSQTADIKPDAVRRIGLGLAETYAGPADRAFAAEPVQRLGAILNSTQTNTREDVLAGLGDDDPDFAADVRKAIFTFKDIATRIKPTDIPNCMRNVDNAVLTTAIAAALGGDAEHAAAADFILANLSQRLAGQLRDDAAEMGRIRPAKGEAAMNDVTRAIREMIERGEITYAEPEDDDAD